MDEGKTINISLPKALLNAIDKQAEVEFRNRSDLIREAVRTYIANNGGMSLSHKLTDTEHARIKGLVTFADHNEQPAIFLSCAFRPQPNTVKDIFTGGSKIVELIENPPRIRSMGWDLRTLDRAKPVAGEYLEVANGKRMLLRLYRDGQHTFAGGMDYFGHGVNSDRTNDANFNLLSIAEWISNFATFSKRVAEELSEKSNEFIFTIVVSNPGRIPINMHATNGIRTDVIGKLELEWAERNIVIANPAAKTDFKIAYQIYAELCYFFGIRTDNFWYVNKEKQEMNKDSFTRM